MTARCILYRVVKKPFLGSVKRTQKKLSYGILALVEAFMLARIGNLNNA